MSEIPYHQKMLRSVGRMFPHEMVRMMGDMCSETLHNWLTANNAPQQAIDLVGMLDLLRSVEAKVEAGTLPDRKAEELPDWIAGASAAIAELGGSFYGYGGSEMENREPIQWTRDPVPAGKED